MFWELFDRYMNFSIYFLGNSPSSHESIFLCRSDSVGFVYSKNQTKQIRDKKNFSNSLPPFSCEKVGLIHPQGVLFISTVVFLSWPRMSVCSIFSVNFQLHHHLLVGLVSLHKIPILFIFFFPKSVEIEKLKMGFHWFM